jgi:hypothetical protein
VKPLGRVQRLFAFMLAGTLISACSGGGGGGGGFNPPGGGPTPTPTPGSFTQANFDCPTSDSAAAVARSSTASVMRGGSAENLPRQRLTRGRRGAYSPSLLAISYDLGYTRTASAKIAQRETTLGAHLMQQLEFDRLGTATRVVTVDPSKLAAMQAQLRTQPGVRNVSRVGVRFASVVTNPRFTNDPYFEGFAGSTAPFWELSSLPGQWDMHAMGLEFAFGYSEAGNGSGVVNAGALGSSSVRLAVIDTGEDTTHPELHTKVVYQKCFVSNPNNQQSISNFTTDPQGHGTDVAGIAVADLNNALGFAGSGGNVSLMGYRVFPLPDQQNCATDTTNDPTCGASTLDIASSINDAVAHGASVINLSLGGSDASGNGCSPAGTDIDPTEGAAIANAIAHNVVVVAASGNGIGGGSNPGQLDAPACDTGVIAAGATSLDDGAPNGAGGGGNAHPSGTTASPQQYVASYSQFGAPAAMFRNASAWGIVAPGADPSANTDNDNLHWIENLWTSTAFDGSSVQACTPDFRSTSATDDCRILIAGTSMSTPHVAGAAAVIISANSSYANPARMKTLLCQTADQINDAKEGCGSLNVYRAMAKAVGDPVLP